MKYFIISDIHSNLEALLVIMEYKNKYFNNAKLICLGDIIGYGANPNECIEIVFNNADSIVMGNHDAGVIGLTDIKCFNYSARQSIQWTKKQLSKKYIKKLNNIPFYLNIGKFKIVHSTLSTPKEWKYVFSVSTAYEEFNNSDFNVLFYGHTHIPMIFENRDNEIKLFIKERYELLSKHSYMINPGSIGQPRNEDSRASAIIYDEDKKTVEYIKLIYDIEKAANKIIKAGLPATLAERLREGL